MTQDWLDSLLSILVEQELASDINCEHVIEKFKHLIPSGKRRLELQIMIL